MILPSGPGIPEDYQRIIDSEISDLGGDCVVRVVCPYVTSSGLTSLFDNREQGWASQCDSEWVVGLNQGITESDALRELLTERENISTRIFLPEESVSSYAMYSDPQIHAKGYIIETDKKESVISGSANITDAAIGSSPSNYELGSINRSLSEEDKSALSEWWHDIRGRSVELTEEIIQKYSDVTSSDRFSSDGSTAQSTQRAPIETSRFLWIYTGDLSSGSRHQLDLKRELAAFFSDEQQEYEISIEIDGCRYDENQVTYRPDRHAVPQWRIHLPTTSDGFDQHADNTRFWCNKYVRFEQVAGSDMEYKVVVEDGRNPHVEDWYSKSQEFGVCSTTGTVGGRGEGREYGFY